MKKVAYFGLVGDAHQGHTGMRIRMQDFSMRIPKASQEDV